MNRRSFIRSACLAAAGGLMAPALFETAGPRLNPGDHVLREEHLREIIQLVDAKKTRYAKWTAHPSVPPDAIEYVNRLTREG